MTVCTMTRIERRRLKAPEQDGATLFEPPGCPGELIAENAAIEARWQADIQGRSLDELIHQGRCDLLEAAHCYTSTYREPADHSRRAAADGPTSGDAASWARRAARRPILLAGHQPEMFHPGVWLKNFALGRLADGQGATAVNLLIDNDVVRQTTVRIAGGRRRQPRFISVAFDRPDDPVPFEHRRILSRDLFDSFADRAGELIRPFVGDPLLETLWPLAIQRADATDNLGQALAQSRHLLEARWGLNTLEVPQSHVCRTPSFRWFACHLLAQLPRLHDVYNDVVRRYRRRHGIRSEAHPVPELAARDRRLEAPLWIWTDADPRRRPLWVEGHGDRITIGDGQSLRFELPLSPDGDARDAVARLDELERQGVRIRSRALTTTLWARLALGRLFIHGIGGAKYDELTDGLFERFLGIEPPRLMVVSGTLRLAAAERRIGEPDPRALQRTLRRLTYHPEVFIDRPSGEGQSKTAEQLASNVAGAGSIEGSAEVQPSGGGAVSGEAVDRFSRCSPRVVERLSTEQLVALKRRWIATPKTPENSRLRHEAIQRVNELLQPAVAPRRAEVGAQLERAERQAAAARVLHWREFCFCLHSRRRLRDFLDQTLPLADAACFNEF